MAKFLPNSESLGPGALARFEHCLQVIVQVQVRYVMCNDCSVLTLVTWRAGSSAAVIKSRSQADTSSLVNKLVVKAVQCGSFIDPVRPDFAHTNDAALARISDVEHVAATIISRKMTTFDSSK